ncbi:hypothetical protein MASR2M15_02930 [Anaerolineales bacterium]
MMDKAKIAVITNDANQVFQQAVISGLRLVLEPDNLLILDAVGKDEQNLNVLSIDPIEMDAFIVIANVLSDGALHKLQALGKPITLVSHQVADLSMPSIRADSEDGMRRLVDHLVQCGCREFVFISGNMKQVDGVVRRQVFEEHLLRYDLELKKTHLLPGDFEVDIAEQSLETFLQLNLPFDAILASDYLMGVRALEVLKRHQFDVPHQVCVAGFGDGCEAVSADLTTVSIDIIELGERAGRQLLAQLKGIALIGTTFLRTEVICRASSC